MKFSTLIAVAFLAIAAISPAAWAVSGQPLAAVRVVDPGRFFSTTDAPNTFYCVSEFDPAGNLISSMMSQDLMFQAYYGPVEMNTKFQLGTGGSWSHTADCPTGSYVHGVGLTLANSPVSTSQATMIKLQGGGQPACIQFTLNGVSGLFGASIYDSGANDYVSALVTSEYLGGPVSYSLGGSNSTDCPLVDTYVSNVTVH